MYKYTEMELLKQLKKDGLSVINIESPTEDAMLESGKHK